MGNELFSQEEIILISDDKLVTITNKRIEIVNKVTSESMFWEEVEKIEVYRYVDIYILIVCIMGVFVAEQILLPAGVTFFLIIQLLSIIVIFLAWLLFHRSVISIISITGKKINITVNFRARKKLQELKNKIEMVRKKEPGILTP